MFKDLEIMKALRYLLIVVAMISVLSVRAQRYAQPPQVQMYSTSAMISSGSTLPSAATTGAILTGSTPGTYERAYRPGAGPRRVGEDDGFEEDDPDPDVPANPFPIGDAVLPLLVLALGYTLWRRRRALRDV